MTDILLNPITATTAAPLRGVFRQRGLLLTLLLVFAAQAKAGLQLELAAGAGYDSNVAPDVTDINAGLGDSYHALEASLGWRTAGRRGVQFETSYWLKEQRWQVYSEYDNRLQTGLLRFGYQGDVLATDVALIAATADVDGQSYMQLERISPALGFIPSESLYVRTQFDFMRKTYEQNSARDSERSAARLQLYWFFRSSGLSLSALIQGVDEQADAQVYSYQAGIGRLSLRHRSRWFGLSVVNHLRARLEQRQYDDVTEQRQRLEISSRWQLSQRWQWSVSLQRDDRQSDFAAASYDQNRLESAIRWSF
ncbi:hypothetical protein HUF18_04085 [Thalassolituus sp. ST750PaO-4]|uniref:hypothetical protein n=1 Tax=Thalassolituus sp. ST750PaO-4 TaxID=2742965 RepID=UPI000C3D4E82|nr:hypothetical protein [Thalassolituus sp. ST750PaO-4]MCA6058943.1 hypothetical protein [Thalassolituus sp. ST750PaO-4]PIQ39955.1 MAG: hypothetical protein COW58_08830 [Thalassolituus sp. CG17_big_fil_post_rev_8_21_14_2_50_53_8]